MLKRVPRRAFAARNVEYAERAEVVVKLPACDQESSRFTSRAIDSVQPAGTCIVDTDEELIQRQTQA
jgi:hypothetical protein